MAISEEILATKWNEFGSDSMCLWNGSVLFIIKEGDGSNLSDEDIEEGFEDYWITNWYGFVSGVFEADGGQWMETQSIHEHDYTIAEVLGRLQGCDLWRDDWELLDDDTAGRLYNIFEELTEAHQKKNSAEWALEEFIEREGLAR